MLRLQLQLNSIYISDARGHDCRQELSMQVTSFTFNFCRLTSGSIHKATYRRNSQQERSPCKNKKISYQELLQHCLKHLRTKENIDMRQVWLKIQLICLKPYFTQNRFDMLTQYIVEIIFLLALGGVL